ncbi:MAG: FAD-dependent oxidoreductase [Candidatus Hodarchaeota archaeon]
MTELKLKSRRNVATERSRDSIIIDYSRKSKLQSSVLVIGGGIAGMQTALDLTKLGFFVYLVEIKPTIGGTMAQLDKIFPTLDCSLCILAPKMVDVYRNPNIELYTYSYIKKIEGNPGDYLITLIKKRRYIKEDVCKGCGDCANICPVKGIPMEFDFNLKTRGSIYIPFPSSVPPVYLIDDSKCLYLNYGICGLCAKFCSADAIDFSQKQEELVLNVGAIVIATGYIQKMPDEYFRFAGESPNVLSSMQFERLLSANGPTGGEIVRLDDRRHPRSIAFIQCVGSRDFHHLDCKRYCSLICCMSSAKEAIVTKEHDPSIECYIFNTEIRAKGKNFYDFIEKSKEEYGVKYINGRVPIIKENPKNGNLKLSYEDIDTGIVKSCEVEMVVLASALFPNNSYYKLLNCLNAGCSDLGYIEDDNRIELEKKNIFFTGFSRKPEDITIAVAEGSACAAKISAKLHSVRFQNITELEYPPEIPVNIEDEPRVGILVCRCGINIGGFVDVPKVIEYVSKLPYVVHAEENMYSCSSDSQLQIKEMILKFRLNRFIVASCTPRTHEQLFQNTLKEIGLNPFLFELVNIRNQDSWVHQNEPEKATEKACDLIRMYLAKVINLKPLKRIKVNIKQSTLIIGGGIAGIIAARNLSDQGFEVYLVDMKSALGGNALEFVNLYYISFTKNDILREINYLKTRSKVHILLNSKIIDIQGYIGNYHVKIKNLIDSSKDLEITIGTIIVATGTKQIKTNRWNDLSQKYINRIMTQTELTATKSKDLPTFKDATIILCVDQRKNEFNRGDNVKSYCSNICCGVALKNIEKLLNINPEAHLHILYREFQFSDLKAEKLWRKLRIKVTFEKYNSIDDIIITDNNGNFRITYNNVGAGTKITYNTDLLILATPKVPVDGTEELAKMLKVPITKDGFFLEADQKLRPIDFATEGIFMCGGAHWPKWIDETITQAYGAAGRAAILMTRGEIETEGIISHINEKKCIGCGRCIEICPYNAIDLVEITKKMGLYTVNIKKAKIIEVMCKCCGACVTECPVDAIDQNHFSKVQINKMIDLLTGIDLQMH